MVVKNPHLGDKIRSLRQNHGHTQTSLEEKLGLSNGTISNWENNPEPPTHGIIKICNFYNIFLIDFVLIDEDISGYVPSWIRPEQIAFIKSFNNIPKEKQVKLLKAFIEIVDALE